MKYLNKLIKNNVAREIVEWIICFLIAYVLYLFINIFFGTVSGVKQSSMYPTVKEGERVLVGRRVLYNKQICRGDIVTFVAPDAVASENSILAVYNEKYGLEWFSFNILSIGKINYIKRVIGVAGDRVYISEDGKVYLNDELLEEDYLEENVFTTRSGRFFDVTVPDGYVFVMGDNRKASKDSREFGVVPLDKIEGKVGIRIWPLNKIGEI